jgi:hypothetical protein
MFLVVSIKINGDQLKAELSNIRILELGAVPNSSSSEASGSNSLSKAVPSSKVAAKRKAAPKEQNRKKRPEPVLEAPED